MTENITYLSPNGQNISYGTGTVTRIYAATIKGVVTLDRQLRGKPWIESARTLEDLHIGALLFDRVRENYSRAAITTAVYGYQTMLERAIGASSITGSSGRTFILWRPA